MLRFASRALAAGLVLLGGALLTGCGGGGGQLTGAAVPSAAGSVSVQIGSPGRSTQPATATAVLWGEGMANAASKTVTIDPDPTKNVVTFESVPEGNKLVRVDLLDSDGGIAAMGFDKVVVSPGTSVPSTPSVSSAWDWQTTVLGTTTVLGKPVSILSEGYPTAPGKQFFYSTSKGGVFLNGWTEYTPLMASTTRDRSPVSYGVLLLEDPLPIIVPGTGPGSRWQHNARVFAVTNSTLTSPAEIKQSDLVAIGNLTVLSQYESVHGVSVPAGNFANASLLTMQMQGEELLNSPIPFFMGLDVTTYVVKGVGEVMSRTRDYSSQYVSETVRLLVPAPSAALTSTTRGATPYALSDALFPLDVGRTWTWKEVAPVSYSLTDNTSTLQ